MTSKLTWLPQAWKSQIRNWFTDRRVENKRAGIFPPDKILVQCSYCEVTLESEVEQKSHLFSTHHVREILGPEFYGANGSESIKWKKLPSSVNAVSKASGARILAVGYTNTQDKTSPDTKECQTDSSIELIDELSTSDETQSKNLQKRWADSVLLQSERENILQKSSSAATFSKKKFGLHYNNNSKEQDKEKIVFIKMEDGEERIVKSNVYNGSKSSTGVLETELAGNKNVPFSSSVSITIPLVSPGDPCSSKSNFQELYSLGFSDAEATDINEGTQSGFARPMKSTSPGENIEENELVESSQFSSGLLKEPKIEQDSVYDDGDYLSNITISKVESLQEQKKCEIFPVPVNEQPITSSCENANLVFNRASGSKRSHNFVMRISSKTPRASESSSSYGGSREVKSKSTQYLQASYMDSHYFSSRRSSGDILDESVIIGYQCPTCSKIFQTEWLMIKHSTVHYKYVCDICEHVFSSEITLKYHIHDHLTAAYEDEKYYCQFSCKTCHSLKCECFEATYCKPKEIPQGYSRPQKARRSKKTFINKVNSGPNDHLKVTLADYKRYFRNPGDLENIRGKRQRLCMSQKSTTIQRNSNNHHTQRQQIDNNLEESALDQEFDNSHETSTEYAHQDRTKQTTESAESSKDIMPVVMHNDLVDVKSELISRTLSEDLHTVGEPIIPKKGRRPFSRRRPISKLSSNFIYKDTDFYYMCESCDASFLSKAELSEHMFFHRLKSRSRRGEKRGASSTAEEERKSALKRLKIEELESNEVATINVGGFERFKCPMCRGHFASITDLNRHRTQAHKGFDTDESLDVNMPVRSTEVFQCAYCEKLYRRERELRRHLKHDCISAPKHLKTKLENGVTLSYLENTGDGPHYRIIKKSPDENSAGDPLPSKPSNKVTHKGPITCKYCLMVTRREAEMKRHVWKYCMKIPKNIVKQFKEGATLEELGFLYSHNKLESSDSVSQSDNLPVTESEKTNISSDEPQIATPKVATPQIAKSQIATSEVAIPPITTPLITTQTATYAASPQGDTSEIATPKVATSQMGVSQVSNSQAAVPVSSSLFPFPLSMMQLQFSKSKEPLVCSYCGLWYFREAAILKHMKERCIKIPPFEKEILISGAHLCNVPQDNEVPASESLQLCRAIYKKVEVLDHHLNSENMNTISNGTSVLSHDLRVSNEAQREESSMAVNKVKVPLEIRKTTKQSRGLANRKGTKCRRCHENFKSPEAVLAHSSVHHGPKNGFYKCKLCQIRMPKYKQLREHVWEHTEETPYRCHVCEVKFRSSEILIEHLHEEHNFNLIKERNLYKWLPTRNGRYREIKPIAKDNCEESLEDLDTNLDNLAEVMVITDNDIWTGRNETQKSVGIEKVGDKKLTENDQKEVIESNQSGKVESSTLKNQSSLSEGNTVLNAKELDHIADKGTKTKQSSIHVNDSLPPKEILEEEDVNHHTVEKDHAKTGQRLMHFKEETVCIAVAEPEKKLTGGNDKNEKLEQSSTTNKSKNTSAGTEIKENLNLAVKSDKNKEGNTHTGKENVNIKKESLKAGRCANEGKEMENVDKAIIEKQKSNETQKFHRLTSMVNEDELCDDGYAENGEGLLSNVGNLESVVETVHLTDNYLS
ncbi:uncharacterized protein [Cherax quadricarinatus]|uniref:uncharacterized protein isoform X2 n=1 Tax=Cherax quadricarinatus TaxID=27406 RepID=UPI00387E7F07